VGEALELATLDCGNMGNGESLLDQVIAVPYVFIADEAEEVIGDATAGGRDLDLVGVEGHIEIVKRAPSQCRSRYNSSNVYPDLRRCLLWLSSQ